jgi:hypothetical protein
MYVLRDAFTNFKIVPVVCFKGRLVSMDLLPFALTPSNGWTTSANLAKPFPDLPSPLCRPPVRREYGRGLLLPGAMRGTWSPSGAFAGQGVAPARRGHGATVRVRSPHLPSLPWIEYSPLSSSSDASRRLQHGRTESAVSCFWRHAVVLFAEMPSFYMLD